MRRIVTYDIETTATNINIPSKECNGIIFRNGGDVDAFINGVPLPAGEYNNDFANNFPDDVIINDFQITFKPGVEATNKLVSAVRIFKKVAPLPSAKDCKPKSK